MRQLSASSAAGSTEQLAANEAAVKRQSQAYKLLGIQAATAGESVTKTAGTIGRGLTTYATIPAAFIGYEAIKQALDFNQSLLLIRTQAGASQQELEHMNSAVLQLVQSGHSYGQTAQQMAQGLYYVESENIRGARAIAILQAAAAGAAKGQTDMADTTNALTSAMKIWNVPASEAAKTMATIDAVTATGKMHLEDLNNAFQTKFFTTAKQLGIPLEQAGAALDVFTKAGVPAQVAANNMTTSFIKMVTPAKAAVPYLNQLGLTATSLGNDLQSGGLSKALEALATGYQHVEETSGKAAANRAVLESFGGSRSGAPALALVQQQASYMQSLGEIQRLNNPATFWSQVSETMHQPAMQIKQDVAEIGADFIKMGTALAPTVATLASGVSEITNAFSSLPGPIKDAIGVVVGVLAIGGPIGLAVSGIGRLIGGLRVAFGTIGPAAATGAAEADTSLMTIDSALATTTGEVGTLRAALLGLGGSAVLGALAAAAGGMREIQASGPGPGTIHRGGKTYYKFGTGYTTSSGGEYSYAQLRPRPPDTAAERARAEAEDAYYKHHRDGRPPFRPAPITQFALPQNLTNELAKAQAGYGSVSRVDAEIRRYIMGLIHSGRLQGPAIAQAYDELATVQTKGRSSFDQRVHNDTLLARARNDLAQGETAAAQTLLRQDQERLQLMLSEAKGAEERATVLRQLAEVERLRHSKSSAYALSPEIQMQIARADAIDALNPSSYGPDSQQIRLARQAKAAAEKAINSHTLTLQGLTEAWQIVGQENAVLAQAKGAIDTYHAVSSKAIVDGVKGLSEVQQMQLRERIAQSEAHRGYAPNRGEGGTHHTHRVHVTVSSNDSHIVKVTKRHHRQSHQRAGGRR